MKQSNGQRKSVYPHLFLAVFLVICLMTSQGCALSGLLGGMLGGGGGIGLGGPPPGGLGQGGGIGAGAGGMPQPGNGFSGPPMGTGQRQQIPPAELADAHNTLQTKYGINVTGSYDGNDLANVLLFARQYNREDYDGLSYDFAGDRNDSGVLGQWCGSPGSQGPGSIQIYGTSFDVICHEGSHQVTLSGSGRSQQIADEAYQRAQSGDFMSTVTRDYALTDDSEWKAEFFTGLMLTRGIDLSFTVQNSNFNPPQDVLNVANQIYNQNPDTGK